MDRLSTRIAGLLLLAGGSLAALLTLAQERQAAPRASVAGRMITAPTPTKGVAVHDVVVDGVTRRYLLHLPSRREAPAALVIAFHGLGSSAAQQQRVDELSATATMRGFAVAYPEGNDRRWAVGTRAQGAAEIGFMRVLIEDVARRHPIDRARIHATGISNGAQMAMRLACSAPELVASVALIAGGYPRGGECPPGPPRAALFFHGTEDRILPYQGRGALLQPVRGWVVAWASRNGCAATPSRHFAQSEVTGETWTGCRAGADVTLYTIVGGGHTWPGSTTMPGRVSRTISASGVMLDFFAAHPKR